MKELVILATNFDPDQLQHSNSLQVRELLRFKVLIGMF